MSLQGPAPKVGQRVEVPSKECTGTVAYIGSTQFAQGKWIGTILFDFENNNCFYSIEGVVLDKPLGKNNGTVDGKKYFDCSDNFGMFCRQTQLKILSDSPGKSSRTPSRENSSLATPRQVTTNQN